MCGCFEDVPGVAGVLLLGYFGLRLLGGCFVDCFDVSDLCCSVVVEVCVWMCWVWMFASGCLIFGVLFVEDFCFDLVVIVVMGCFLFDVTC